MLPAGGLDRPIEPPAPALPALRAHLAAREEALAAAWRQTVGRTAYVGLTARAVRQGFVELTAQATAAVLAEPFDARAGHDVGAAVVRLGYTTPEALGQTQTVLADQFPAGLGAGEAAALWSRLGPLLQAVAVGFAAAAREALLAEQEAIHSAVLTENRRVTGTLREREVSLAAAQRIAHLGSFDWDLVTDAVAWSDEMFRLFGYAPGEVPPSLETFTEAVHPDDRAVVMQAVQDGFASRVYPFEFRTAGRDGVVRTLLGLAEVVCDATGRAARIFGTALDVTERKRAEAEARRGQAAAEAAHRAKAEFLANMSHEIRTPMNAILGMADVLADSPLTLEQGEYVAIFRQAGDSLLALLNDILDLSKVEAGQLELEVMDFDLAELVESAAEVLAVRAHTKGLELTCEVAPDVPACVRGDPQRLRQVLLNLLGNAVKFTEQGEVHLELTCARPTPVGAGTGAALDGGGGTGGTPVTVRFAVRDTGMGISPEQLAAVFGAFTQADASTTRRYGGSGLGLAIVERLVDLMGGRVEAESALGQGSTFAVTVPLAAAPCLPPEPAATLAGVRVLVVDDSATNRLILRRLLEGHGAAVAEASGGRAALTALRAVRAAGVPYDLLLLDQRMPDMDGFQVVARLREDAAAGEAVIPAVVMLSSDRRTGNAERASALGVTHSLIKPVKRAALLTAIAATLRGGAAGTAGSALLSTTVEVAAPPSATPAPGEERTASPPRRLLLVDDSADNRRLVELYLKSLPYTLDTAADGREGLAAFRPGRYDLVLMDVHMPVLDGLEATRAIRAREHQQDRAPTPVVALTASAMPEDVRRALEAGCDGHVAKPVKKDVLLQAIEQFARAGVDVQTAGATAAGIAYGLATRTAPATAAGTAQVEAQEELEQEVPVTAGRPDAQTTSAASA